MLTKPLHWVEGKIPVLILEHPKVFRNLVFTLSSQADGDEGDFVLSLDYEPLDCADHLHVIGDYAALTLEDRKLQNRFQSLLQSLLQEELAIATNQIQLALGEYMEAVASGIQYPVAFSTGEYVLPLLKAIKFQPVLEGEEPLERLMQYIGIYSSLMKDQCFILVGAHSYYTTEELRELFRMAFYQKWRLLLVEQHSPCPLPEEEICLIDTQLCEIRLDSSNELV